MKKDEIAFSSSFPSFSTNETQKIGETFGKSIKKLPRLTHARVLGLQGNLGAGKTTLIQGIAKSFGIKKRITSPTFVLMKQFPIRIKNYKKFIHIDAYRLSSFDDLESLEIHSLLHDPASVIFIEWIENVSSKILNGCGVITLKHGRKESERIITMKLLKK
jgi:tRNA threonylcarbamoyladenosine biosynthesis protein TsaE